MTEANFIAGLTFLTLLVFIVAAKLFTLYIKFLNLYKHQSCPLRIDCTKRRTQLLVPYYIFNTKLVTSVLMLIVTPSLNRIW